MELREEDLVQVLGVSHKLHVRKIIISRERLRPLSKEEMTQKQQVEAEVSVHCRSFRGLIKLTFYGHVFVLLYDRTRQRNHDKWLEYRTWIQCSVRQEMEG